MRLAPNAADVNAHSYYSSRNATMGSTAAAFSAGFAMAARAAASKAAGAAIVVHGSPGDTAKSRLVKYPVSATVDTMPAAGADSLAGGRGKNIIGRR